ncbi:hypothetical protein [Cobetia sp. QF-1]|uniref:hypothetical protein n=1 Tax=Cobetia sp. QF-1 TaxID=1969833 RepID=UPI00113051FF|nr:hypothetical protein [Cobetia sp. QF-1]
MASLLLACSKVIQTIAFFLPIKVLIMLSLKKPPDYFQLISDWISYEDFIITILALVPGFYLSYMLIGLIYRKMIDKDLALIWNSSFEKNNFFLKGKHLRVAYGQTSRLNSDIFICIIILCMSAIVSFYITSSLIALSLVVLLIFLRYGFAAKEDDRVTFIGLHRKQLVEYISAMVYLALFFILVGLVYYKVLGTYETIFLLLISRLYIQSLQRALVESFHFQANIK